jgi:hypothetical protein
MTPAEVNKNDAILLGHILNKIDSQDVEYYGWITDEVCKWQPFFFSVILDYRHDLTPHQHNEMIKLYLLIWEYFKTKKNVFDQKITQEEFEKLQNRNIQMLKYVSGEKNQLEIMKIYAKDLENIKSKELFAVIAMRYLDTPVLYNLEEKSKAILLIGLKCFIECFEAI